MPEEKWYQNPEKATRAAVFAILLAGGAGGIFPLLRRVGNRRQLCAGRVNQRRQRVPFNFYFHSQRADFRAACGHFNFVAGGNDGRGYQLLADALFVPQHGGKDDCQKQHADEDRRPERAQGPSVDGAGKDAAVFSVGHFNGDRRGQQNIDARLYYRQPHRQIPVHRAGSRYRARFGEFSAAQRASGGAGNAGNYNFYRV